MDLKTLVQRAKKKDKSALDKIYRMYYPQMLGVCTKIIKEDNGVAEDLVHDAFIIAFARIGDLRDNAKFGEWLTTIVRNVSLRYTQQRDRLRLKSISAIDEEDVALADSSTRPDSELEHKELLTLINQLPEGYRKVLKMSIIEGFSHKEIAAILGIEPHSSSSQLSRAKRLLKIILSNKALRIVALLLVPMIVYWAFRQSDNRHADTRLTNEKQDEFTDPNQSDRPLMLDKNHADSLPNPPNIRPTKMANFLAKETEKSPLATDTNVVKSNPQPNVDNENSITRVDKDSADLHIKDSINRVITPIKEHTTEDIIRMNRGWQLLATGSLGSSIAQSDYRLLAIDISKLPESDAAGDALPDHVSTWEEYDRYFKLLPVPDESPKTKALMEIAQHNTGKIEQKEHHDYPITFGLSLAKSISKKWSVETGLQYSMLNSQFQMGENGYSIFEQQKIHYVGIPLRISYNWMDYKRLSIYSSLGTTMHIPVYQKLNTNYFVNWQNVYSESQSLGAPIQWQMGTSIGLQYRFTPNVSIFIEPSFNWFIPSGGDTRTIWSEHPFTFTAPCGIRITW